MKRNNSKICEFDLKTGSLSNFLILYVLDITNLFPKCGTFACCVIRDIFVFAKDCILDEHGEWQIARSLRAQFNPY